MESKYIIKAIQQLKPTAEYSFTNDDYTTIKWDVLEGSAPTQTEIESVIEQIKTKEITDVATKAIEKETLLAKLGITADEAALLLGGN
jgi:predicted RNA binding protein with dsRBD fold (UPF0201 family)